MSSAQARNSVVSGQLREGRALTGSSIPARGVTAMEDDLRTVDPALHGALVRVIEKFIPEAGQAVEETYKGISATTVASHTWAHDLLWAYERASETFGLSSDVEALEEVERKSHELRRLLGELAAPTRRSIEVAKYMMGHPSNVSLMEACKDDLDALARAIQRVRRERKYRTSAGKRNNWQALSVAEACRHIWAQAHWQGPNFKEASEDDWARYHAFLAEKVAHSQKLDGPGSIGNFIEEVNGVLGIKGRDGKPFSARSTLRALARVRST